MFFKIGAHKNFVIFKGKDLCWSLSFNKVATLLKKRFLTNEIKAKTRPSMSHSNWPRVLLFDLANKQCNGIIKGWFHYLTSQSKGRFLVNNILMFGSAWCLVMAQIQFSLIKKIKIGRPEHSLTPHPVRPITSHFSLPQPPHKVDVICVSPLKTDYKRIKE